MVKLVFVFIFSVAAFFATAQTSDLVVKVNNLEVIEDSKIMVALYNSEDSYFDSEQIYRKLEVAVDSTTVFFTISDLPEGTYALTMFHDEDNNDEMDRKWYGPPKEGYAFSNNFTSSIRPARFNDASFELNVDKTLEIEMVY